MSAHLQCLRYVDSVIFVPPCYPIFDMQAACCVVDHHVRALGFEKSLDLGSFRIYKRYATFQYRPRHALYRNTHVVSFIAEAAS